VSRDDVILTTPPSTSSSIQRVGASPTLTQGQDNRYNKTPSGPPVENGGRTGSAASRPKPVVSPDEVHLTKRPTSGVKLGANSPPQNYETTPLGNTKQGKPFVASTLDGNANNSLTRGARSEIRGNVVAPTLTKEAMSKRSNGLDDFIPHMDDARMSYASTIDTTPHQFHPPSADNYVQPSLDAPIPHIEDELPSFVDYNYPRDADEALRRKRYEGNANLDYQIPHAIGRFGPDDGTAYLDPVNRRDNWNGKRTSGVDGLRENGYTPPNRGGSQDIDNPIPHADDQVIVP